MNDVPTGSAADTLSAFAERPESALRTIGFRLLHADPPGRLDGVPDRRAARSR